MRWLAPLAAAAILSTSTAARAPAYLQARHQAAEEGFSAVEERFQGPLLSREDRLLLEFHGRTKGTLYFELLRRAVGELYQTEQCTIGFAGHYRIGARATYQQFANLERRELMNGEFRFDLDIRLPVEVSPGECINNRIQLRLEGPSEFNPSNTDLTRALLRGRGSLNGTEANLIEGGDASYLHALATALTRDILSYGARCPF